MSTDSAQKHLRKPPAGGESGRVRTGAELGRRAGVPQRDHDRKDKPQPVRTPSASRKRHESQRFMADLENGSPVALSTARHIIRTLRARTCGVILIRRERATPVPSPAGQVGRSGAVSSDANHGRFRHSKDLATSLQLDFVGPASTARAVYEGKDVAINGTIPRHVHRQTGPRSTISTRLSRRTVQTGRSVTLHKLPGMRRHAESDEGGAGAYTCGTGHCGMTPERRARNGSVDQDGKRSQGKQTSRLTCRYRR